jgi:hypothetical protein
MGKKGGRTRDGRGRRHTASDPGRTTVIPLVRPRPEFVAELRRRLFPQPRSADGTRAGYGPVAGAGPDARNVREESCVLSTGGEDGL